MDLRPYQTDFKKAVYEAFRRGQQSVLAQLPTGAGKTIIFSSMIRDGFNAGRRCLVLAHRGELIQQAYDKLHNHYGIRAGIIKSGIKPEPHEPVQIASVQTLINRELAYPVDLVIIDEAHHMQGRNTYGTVRQMVLDLKPDAKFLGVTATPCRTNGAGFASVFQELIVGVQIPDLIEQGFLVAPKYYVAPIDLRGIKISAGDYNIKDLSQAYRGKISNEELVNNWLKLANNMKTIGFAIDIEHSKSIVEAYKSAGIAAAHIDGTTNDDVRNRLLNDFRAGRIKVLFNVGVFDEGFDCPDIEAVQLARPSKSLIKYMQMCGRALRPSQGKSKALILDHSGLIAEHDILERKRHWTLGGVERDETKTVKFKDKISGNTYSQPPLGLPMDAIELVEANVYKHVLSPEQKLERDFQVLSHFAAKMGFNRVWIWFQLARKVKNTETYKTELNRVAEFYCNKYGYKAGKAFYLVDEYLTKNKRVAG